MTDGTAERPQPGPGESVIDLSLLAFGGASTHAGDRNRSGLLREHLRLARVNRLDRVVLVATTDQAAAASGTLDELGFRRIFRRDTTTAEGEALLAFVRDLAPVQIRTAGPAELEAAGRLTFAGYVADGVIDPASAYATHLLDAADRATTATLVVAVDAGGAVVGTVTFCRPGSPYAELSTAGEAEFRMLAVDPAARGLGVGAALVHACLDLAAGAGDHRLVLSTQARMVAAGRIYRRLGFVADPSRDWTPQPGIELLAYQRDVVITR